MPIASQGLSPDAPDQKEPEKRRQKDLAEQIDQKSISALSTTEDKLDLGTQDAFFSRACSMPIPYYFEEEEEEKKELEEQAKNMEREPIFAWIDDTLTSFPDFTKTREREIADRKSVQSKGWSKIKRLLKNRCAACINRLAMLFAE